MSTKFFNSEKQESYALEARFKRAFGTNDLRKIAAALGISYPGLNHLLRGNRRLTVDLVKRVSQVTGYSIHWLVTGEGPEKVGRTDEAIIQEYLLRLAQDLSVKNREREETGIKKRSGIKN